MKTPLVNPINVLAFIEAWLQLPLKAFRPPFRKHRHHYQAELLQSFKYYQLAQYIRLPTGQPALQTQQQRLQSLVRKLNSWMGLLTDAAQAELMQQAQQLAYVDGLRPHYRQLSVGAEEGIRPA